MDKTEIVERKEAAHFNGHQADFDPETGLERLLVDPLVRCHIDGRILLKNMTFLGDIAEKTVLIPGSGEAIEAVPLARAGARVVGVDISMRQNKIAGLRARVNGTGERCLFVCGSFNRLPLSDNSIDCVYGHAVLHHVALKMVSSELRRVLRPGGKYVFSEPFGENMFLEFIRMHIPYPGKHRSDDEKPLRYKDIHEFQEGFISNQIVEYQLFSMAERLLQNKRLGLMLEQIDDYFLRYFRFSRRFCRYVILAGEKPGTL